MSEGLTVEWTGTRRRRRVRFECRAAGGWHRVEEVFDATEAHWREVGHEIVADLVVEDSADVTTPVEVVADD